MVASKLTKYWDKKDKYGCKISEWASETDKASIAKCKYCLNCLIDYHSGHEKLIRHAETNKHRNSIPSNSSSSEKVQVSIERSLNIEKNKQITERKDELTIELIRWASRHNISFTSLECLSDILHKASEDKVFENLQLSERKCRYVAAHGIGEYYLLDIIEKIKESDGISIGLDESAMNKREECEIVVKFSHPVHGVQTQHFKTLELHEGDAESIVAALVECFVCEGIEFSQKVVSISSDGAAVMTGHISGLHKRLEDVVPGLTFLTSCMDHHVSNSMQKATTKFDPDLELAMVHLFEDLSGSKGRSLKKRGDFIQTAENVGIVPSEIPKMSTTRFRAIGTCVRSCLQNLEVYKEYYSSLKKPTPRQNLLKIYFVDQEVYTKLKLLFIKYAISDMEDAINFFEESTDNFHLIYSKMETLLRNQLLKFMKDEALDSKDEEGNIVQLRGKKLLKVDIEKKEHLKSKRAVKIGDECRMFMEKLGLEPNDTQVKPLMDSVFSFHQTVARQFQNYFESGLSSTVLKYCSSLSPTQHSKATTKSRILYLANKYKRIIENIDKVDGMDTLDTELDAYTGDKELKEMKDMVFNEYWSNVKEIKECGWTKYKILPRFALAMSTILNSNSECERMFSIQTRLSRDPDRNRMSQKMFESHLSIRSGVESKLSILNCGKCKQNDKKEEAGFKPTAHCHCAVAEVSSSMKDLCKNAWRKDKQITEEGRERSNLEKSLFVSRKRKFDDKCDKELKEMKRKIKSRNTLLPPNKMLRVWEPKSTKKAGDNNSKK